MLGQDIRERLPKLILKLTNLLDLLSLPIYVTLVDSHPFSFCMQYLKFQKDIKLSNFSHIAIGLRIEYKTFTHKKQREKIQLLLLIEVEGQNDEITSLQNHITIIFDKKGLSRASILIRPLISIILKDAHITVTCTAFSHKIYGLVIVYYKICDSDTLKKFYRITYLYKVYTNERYRHT